MPTPIDPTRLPGLRKALEHYDDTDWGSQQQLAELYGVTNARMTTLIKKRFPDFPTHERRDDKTHWYPMKPAIQSMIAYMTNASAAKQAQARRHSTIMGRVVEETQAAAPSTETAAAPPVTVLSATELDRLLSAQTKAWKLKKDMGLYVLAAEVQKVARDVNAMLAREIMNLVNTIDPNGQLPAMQRKKLQDRCRDMTVKMHDALGDYLGVDYDAERNAGATSARAGTDLNNQRRRPRKRADDVGAAA
jgi:hypothetical protein